MRDKGGSEKSCCTKRCQNRPKYPISMYYLAGGQTLASLQALTQGQAYRLNGLKDGSMATGFDANKNSVFGNIHQIDFRQSYCEILLPFPDAVSLLRVVPMQSGCNFYNNPVPPALTQPPASLPLIQVFSYTLASANKPTLDPLSAHLHTALSHH
jgi:hypothetical protein